MENSSWALLPLLCLAALAFLTKIIFRQHPNRKHPPGPKPWPIIGNFNLVGSIPHQSLHSLSQKYGEIMQLKLGKFPVVVASSPEMAKQFLRVHDTVFASRPAVAAGKYTSYNNSDMTWAPYGPYWRQARKIYLSEVLNAKKLDSFEHIRVEERRNFISRLCSLSGKPIVLRDHLSRYTLSIICRMVLSKKYFSIETEDENNNAIIKVDELRGLLDNWFFFSGAFNIGDWMPWLSFLDMQGYVKRMKAFSKKLDRFYDYVLHDHLTRKAAPKDSTVKDVVDTLLKLSEDPNLEVKLTMDHVKGLLQYVHHHHARLEDEVFDDAGKSFVAAVEDSPAQQSHLQITQLQGPDLSELLRNEIRRLLIEDTPQQHQLRTPLDSIHTNCVRLEEIDEVAGNPYCFSIMGCRYWSH
ncbi:Flavonoid 3'-monooxygenase [Sesamum alatum]|uniref:Flavonoid 3'-monooxygenase n=1 Tax=Sesamum alatum TaxID=300844 RepID=A0AAE2C8Z0_9LAMI|nr:Flavonoid 3'-monooxygenase [Sesamum alatum]